MSKEKVCGKPANVEFAWASKIMAMCEHHARGVAAVGNAMGSVVELREKIPNSVCESRDQHPDDKLDGEKDGRGKEEKKTNT